MKFPGRSRASRAPARQGKAELTTSQRCLQGRATQCQARHSCAKLCSSQSTQPRYAEHFPPRRCHAWRSYAYQITVYVTPRGNAGPGNASLREPYHITVYESMAARSVAQLARAQFSKVFDAHLCRATPCFAKHINSQSTRAALRGATRRPPTPGPASRSKPQFTTATLRVSRLCGPKPRPPKSTHAEHIYALRPSAPPSTVYVGSATQPTATRRRAHHSKGSLDG